VSFSAGDLYALAGLAALVGGAGTGTASYLIRRRASGGRVGTSEAATLWAQSQEMRGQLLAEKQKAEEQRDRLMTIQADQVVPVLTATNESLKQIAASLSMLNEMIATQEQMSAMIRELRDRYIGGTG
jgi:hypothetical protein